MNVGDFAKRAYLEEEFLLDPLSVQRFTKFADLVAAHEREECAKLFESIHTSPTAPFVHFSLSDTAKIIRARSKA